MGTGELSGKDDEKPGGDQRLTMHHPIEGGITILLVTSCYENQNKPRMGHLAPLQILKAPANPRL